MATGDVKCGACGAPLDPVVVWVEGVPYCLSCGPRPWKGSILECARCGDKRMGSHWRRQGDRVYCHQCCMMTFYRVALGYARMLGIEESQVEADFQTLLEKDVEERRVYLRR